MTALRVTRRLSGVCCGHKASAHAMWTRILEGGEHWGLQEASYHTRLSKIAQWTCNTSAASKLISRYLFLHPHLCNFVHHDCVSEIPEDDGKSTISIKQTCDRGKRVRCQEMNQELDTSIYISGIELKGHPNIIQRQRVRARRCLLTTRLYHFSSSMLDVCVCAQSCPTLCNPMDCCSPPGSSVHGIFQARIPERVVISYVPFIQCPPVEDCTIF